MKRGAFLARNQPRLRCAWAVFVVAAIGVPATVFGADRVVLCEEFTQLTGLPCERAGLALEMLVDDYPDSLALVQAHLVGDPRTTWGRNRFFYFYGFQYTPSASFDAVDTIVGAWSVTQIYNEYRSMYLARLAVATDVTLALSAVHVSGSTYEITATVCVEPEGIGKTMRIYIAQVLDHWPPSPTYHRNGLKQMAGTVDVTVAPGNCQDVVRTFTFDSDSWAAMPDIRIVAWAQKPSSSFPAEVYQAAWILVPVFGDMDDDRDVDLEDYAGFVDCMAGPGAAPSPTPPATAQQCLEAFDIDADADVDLMDFVAFLTVFGEQP